MSLQTHCDACDKALFAVGRGLVSRPADEKVVIFTTPPDRMFSSDSPGHPSRKDFCNWLCAALWCQRRLRGESQ